MLLAIKSGNISASKLISETDTEWHLLVEKQAVTISKTDKHARAFRLMSDALKWAGAESELIEDFVQKEAAETAGDTPAALA